MSKCGPQYANAFAIFFKLQTSLSSSRNVQSCVKDSDVKKFSNLFIHDENVQSKTKRKTKHNLIKK